MEPTKEYYDEFDIQNRLNLEIVDSSIILYLLSKKNISKAAGIDKFSHTFIEDRAESIANHFINMINFSIESSPFPDLCKLAKLIALFKKELRTEAKNYPPIFLIQIFSKIFDKVVHI